MADHDGGVPVPKKKKKTLVRKKQGGRAPVGGMTDRMKKLRFVRAYIQNGGNLTKAALAAGLANTYASASVHGSLMMKRADVCHDIARRLDAIEATTDRILEETARVAFSDVRDLREAEDAFRAGEAEAMSDTAASTIRGVKVRRQLLKTNAVIVEDVEVQGQDKIAALKLLAMLRRMIGVRVEHTGAGGGPIAVEHAVQFYLPPSPHLVVDVEAQALPLEQKPSNGNGHAAGESGSPA